MDTVRLARDLGNVSGLLPTGISSLREIPYPLLQAIKAALVYLSFEEWGDDAPPRSIWTDPGRVNEHFDHVHRRRKERMEGREISDPIQNDAVRMLVSG